MMKTIAPNGLKDDQTIQIDHISKSCIMTFQINGMLA